MLTNEGLHICIYFPYGHNSESVSSEKLEKYSYAHFVTIHHPNRQQTSMNFTETIGFVF